MGSDHGDRFIHDLEVLEVCRELLLSNSDAKARMALILLDGLTDALLHRRIERAYEASEELWLNNPRFPKSVRTRARLNFAERTRLAQTPIRGFLAPGSDEPLVNDFEAVVLLICHSYRNAAYHRDSHNPAAIRPLARLMFTAVASIFARSHRSGLIGFSLAEETLLDSHSVDADVMKTRGEAAAEVAARLSEGLEVGSEELRTQFTADLDARVEQVEGWLAYLPLGERRGFVRRCREFSGLSPDASVQPLAPSAHALH